MPLCHFLILGLYVVAQSTVSILRTISVDLPRRPPFCVLGMRGTIIGRQERAFVEFSEERIRF